MSLITLASDWIDAVDELDTAVAAAATANSTVNTKRAAVNTVLASILTQMQEDEKQLAIVDVSGEGVVMVSNGSSVQVSKTTIEV